MYEGAVFAGSALESVRIPSTLRVVERDTFEHCRSLQSVTLSEGVENIKSGAFYETGLQEVHTPSSLRRIGSNAFGNCENLKLVSWKKAWRHSERATVLSSTVVSKR